MGRYLSVDRFNNLNPAIPDDKLVLASVHEAAHAVVAWCVGCPLKRVILGYGPDVQRPDGVVGGFTELDMGAIEWDSEPDADVSRIKLEKKLLIWLAGGMAERRLVPHIDQETDDYDTKVLYDDLATYCLSDDEINATFRLAEIRCRNLLARDDVWRAVRELAGALLVKTEILGDDVCRMIGSQVKPGRNDLLRRTTAPILATVTRAMFTLVPGEMVADWSRLRDRKRNAIPWPKVCVIRGELFEPVPEWQPETVEAWSAEKDVLMVMHRKVYRVIRKKSAKRLLHSLKQNLLT